MERYKDTLINQYVWADYDALESEGQYVLVEPDSFYAERAYYINKDYLIRYPIEAPNVEYN